MAANFDVKSVKSDVHAFFPHEITVPAHLNGRTQLPDIDWLVLSIVEHGQLQNCVIRKDGDKPTLGVGFSRWRAISQINEMVKDAKKRAAWLELHPKIAPTDFPVVALRLKCEFKKWNELEMFIANINENYARNPTTTLDDAHNCAQLKKWDMSDDDIAAVYPGKSASWVKKQLEIASADPKVLKAVADGRIRLNAVSAIAKLSAEQQREAVAGEGKIKPAKKANPAPSKGELKLIASAEDTPDEIKSLIQWILGLAPRAQVRETFDWIPERKPTKAKAVKSAKG